ncbi:MAG: caspase family protein, partial [Leptospiraceae bacterium]|nr:caspase family protein [Leptospiraceae bacterium]
MKVKLLLLLFLCLSLFASPEKKDISNQSTKEEKPKTFTYKPFETNAKGMAIVPAKKLGVWNESVRVALVVGVSAYPKMSGLSPLKFGASDARQFSEVLKQVGKFGEGNVIVLNDDLGQSDASLKPTKENILRAFKTLVDKRPEVFLFYFSGHGFEINNENVVAPLDALMGKRLRYSPECFKRNKRNHRKSHSERCATDHGFFRCLPGNSSSRQGRWRE